MALFNEGAKTAESTTPPAIGSKKEKQKAADDARRAKRKGAFDVLMAIGKDVLGLGILDDAQAQALKQALSDLRPLRSSTPTVRETMADKLGRMFATKDLLTGYDVYNFEACHYGETDMRRNVSLALKTAAPEKRLWIEYNGKADEYKVMGRGPKPPLGWTGYTPVDAAVVAETGAVPASE